MGGGNAQKSATARARNEAKKAKAGKGSQLAVNKAAQSIVCQVCVYVFAFLRHRGGSMQQGSARASVRTRPRPFRRPAPEKLRISSDTSVLPK